MNNRRTSFKNPTSRRRPPRHNGAAATGGDDRGNRAGSRKRPFRQRSAATASKMPPPRPGSRPKTKKPWDQVKRPKITSDLQVTDGRHQGKLLANVETVNRSVSPRNIRENMFRLLARRIRAGRFLDLCAGNGTIGIEALSRGAMLGTFVERSTRMCTCIRNNLEACGVRQGHAEIFSIEAEPFLRRVGKKRRFWDVVYCGMPNDRNYDAFLKCFGNGFSIRPGGVLILEHPSELVFPESVGLLKRWRVIEKDGVALSIFERV